jgi:pullulanase/glycogen debranching enzyme
MWLAPSGAEMASADWHEYGNHAFACQIEAAPGALPNISRRLLLVLNPDSEASRFMLPKGTWQLALDSSGELAHDATFTEHMQLPAHSVLVLRELSH